MRTGADFSSFDWYLIKRNCPLHQHLSGEEFSRLSGLKHLHTVCGMEGVRHLWENLYRSDCLVCDQSRARLTRAANLARKNFVASWAMWEQT